MLDVVFENRVVDLMRDEVDIAVRVMTDPPDNLVARDMGPVRYVACATPGYAQAQGMPATLEDLSRAPLITSAVVGSGKAFNSSSVKSGIGGTPSGRL